MSLSIMFFFRNFATKYGASCLISHPKAIFRALYKII